MTKEEAIAEMVRRKISAGNCGLSKNKAFTHKACGEYSSDGE